MQEAVIRAQLATVRGEFRRVEAEYLVLRDLTKGYVRWLGILGLDDEPGADDVAAMQEGGVGKSDDEDNDGRQHVDARPATEEAFESHEQLEPASVAVIEVVEDGPPEHSSLQSEPNSDVHDGSDSESPEDDPAQSPGRPVAHSDLT